MAERHPALAETTNYIAKAVEEEAAKPNSTPHPVNYSDNNYPYHMEDFTDEEEMDSSQVSLLEERYNMYTNSFEWFDFLIFLLFSPQIQLLVLHMELEVT